MASASPSDDREKQRRLTPEQRHIVYEKGTEPPFSGVYLHNKTDGMYRCVVCGQELFSSDTKFDSGSGWPSFWTAVGEDKVVLREDHRLGMRRTEVSCKHCGAHLGHVFNDGPRPSGQRYCINSLALNFQSRDAVRGSDRSKDVRA